MVCWCVGLCGFFRGVEGSGEDCIDVIGFFEEGVVVIG